MVEPEQALYLSVSGNHSYMSNGSVQFPGEDGICNEHGVVRETTPGMK